MAPAKHWRIGNRLYFVSSGVTYSGTVDPDLDEMAAKGLLWRGPTLGRTDAEKDGGSRRAYEIMKERALKGVRIIQRERKRKEKRARRESGESSKDYQESSEESEDEIREETEEERERREDITRREEAFAEKVKKAIHNMPPGTRIYRGDPVFHEDVEFKDYSFDVCFKVGRREVLEPIEKSSRVEITSKICFMPDSINPVLQLSIRGYYSSLAIEKAKAKIMQAIEAAVLAHPPDSES